jgi:hypothetical protein
MGLFFGKKRKGLEKNLFRFLFVGKMIFFLKCLRKPDFFGKRLAGRA